MTDQPDVRHETVLKPAGESLAAVYAAALLETLPLDEEARAVAAELGKLAALLDEEAGFEALLAGALLTRRERVEMAGRVFHGRVSQPVEALLGVMAEAGRMELLGGVARTFRAAMHRREGKVEVQVTTAVPLDESARRHVREVLAEALRAEPVLSLRVDRGLLGGMTLRIGDQLFDASVRTELRRLQQRLAEELTAEAQP